MKEQIEPQKVIKHLSEKWGEHPCPMCGHHNWSISDKLFELREYNDGNLVIGNGPILALSPVTCNNCGNTVFVNAIVSNIVDKPNPETK